MVKSYRWGGVGWGGGGGPCDYCVTPVPIGLGFGLLGVQVWDWVQGDQTWD